LAFKALRIARRYLLEQPRKSSVTNQAVARAFPFRNLPAATSVSSQLQSFVSIDLEGV